MILAFFIIPAIICIIIIYIVSSNRVEIAISEESDGSFNTKIGRYRLAKDGFYYPIQSLWYRFFKKGKISIPHNRLETFIVNVESAPLFGIKKAIKFKSVDGVLFPYSPPTKIDLTGFTSDTKVVKMRNIRQTYFEATKKEISREEILFKFVLPMGLIVLAMALLIFFPKIYHAIMEESNRNYQQASNFIFDYIQQNKPPG